MEIKERMKKFTQGFAHKPQKKNDGWISVKDRMPEDSCESILIYGSATCGTCDPEPKVREGSYSSTYSDGRDLDWKFGEYECSCEVTHWMPLPEPPDNK